MRLMLCSGSLWLTQGVHIRTTKQIAVVSAYTFDRQDYGEKGGSHIVPPRGERGKEKTEILVNEQSAPINLEEYCAAPVKNVAMNDKK